MEVQSILDWCRSRPGVTDELPFGPDARVFKVWDKMFAVLPAVSPDHITLKCEPRFAEHLRAEHAAIKPGYHTNKRHWNTVHLDGTLPPGLVDDLLGHAYTIVVDGLPRRYRSLARGTGLLDDAAYRTGDLDASESPLLEARRQADTAGDRRCLAAALDQLAVHRHWRNLEPWNGQGFPEVSATDVAAELELAEQGLAIRRGLGHPAETGESVFHVGLVYQLYRDEWDEAARCFAEARALAEEAGDVRLLSEARRHEGSVSWHALDFDSAIEHLAESLVLRRRLGWHVHTGLLALGSCEFAAGRRAEGMAHLREGLDEAQRDGLREKMWAPARRTLDREEGGP
jgi:predicted DNA-binding protein (MmcQ/YjbR family)